MGFCGKIETVIGCSFGSDESTEGQFRIYSPAKGEIGIYGCGVDTKLLVEKSGPTDFVLPNLVAIGKRGNCVLDVEFNFRLQDSFPRAIRGRVFVDRRGPGQTSSEISGLNRTDIGTSAYKIRQGFESTIQTIRVRTSKPTLKGYFQIYGCGAGIKLREFSGEGFEFDLSELVKTPTEKSDCFLFGWAVDGSGLNDTFSIGLTVFSKDDIQVGAHAYLNNKKVCFVADKYVSLISYGNQVSFKLEDCFNLTEETLISFYTIKGRVRHGVLEDGEFKWKD
jgi:hypothetical protein